MSGAYHTPVLLHTSVQALQVQASGIYVDATFGGGGHSAEILAKLGPGGKLFAFDQDPDAKDNAIQNPRFRLIRENFRYMKKFLRLEKVHEVQGILADLGVSSHQFDQPSRGFSNRFDTALDMRMDPSLAFTAADILQNATPEKLQGIFSRYGEIRNARALAHAIKSQARTIRTTGQLLAITAKMSRGDAHKYAAQVFQALRIEVNDELGALREMLEDAKDLLIKGGRLVVISYHSLEDRMVKNFMRSGNVDGEPEEDALGRKDTPFMVITKKPVTPDAHEIKDNPRARSARLRIAERK